MKNFRVQVWHQQHLLGHFDITETRGADSVGLVCARFPQSLGFRTEVLLAEEESRLLECGRDGVKLLSRQLHYRPWSEQEVEE